MTEEPDGNVLHIAAHGITVEEDDDPLTMYPITAYDALERKSRG